MGCWIHIAGLIASGRSFIRDRRGATAIEYGLIAGGIALIISGAVLLAGQDLKELFDALATRISLFVDDVDL